MKETVITKHRQRLYRKVGEKDGDPEGGPEELAMSHFLI